MADPRNRSRLKNLARDELGQLLKTSPSDRLWQLPVSAAIAMGLPLFAGTLSGHLELGLVGSLAGLVFLYVPNTPLPHRMVWLAACAIAMTVCYTIGVFCHQVPFLLVPVIGITTIVSSMVCRFFAVAPPGSLFFMMVTAIGAYTPVKASGIPLLVGVFAVASVFAWVVALCYSIVTIPSHQPVEIRPRPRGNFDFLVIDPVIIGIFVALSLVIAELLHLQKAYWVSVSCLVVIQQASLRAIWIKKVHRIVGTTIGLGLAWALLSIPFNPWLISLFVTVLAFIVETIVVRHYGVAAIFITPLAILLAEAATFGHGSADLLIKTRFYDTLLGCGIGFIGGICLHNPAFRSLTARLVGKRGT